MDGGAMKRTIGMALAVFALIPGLFFGLSAAGYLAAGWLPVWFTKMTSDPTRNLDPNWADVVSSALCFAVLMLAGVMVIASMLTLAERKWSAFMQDRMGPNRARLSIIPGLKDRPLAGIPHFMADGLKMLTKEGFTPDEAYPFIFRLAPILNFAPVFCLFAIVPAGPAIFAGVMSNGRAFHADLQVLHPDFGLLFIFALASIAVYGTALAGWASSNKFALLGGVRATSQMISYEVALGLSLVGMMCVANTLRLDAMVDFQGGYIWQVGDHDFGLPRWGIFLQPIGFILFFTAAFAETKRAPFDLPEGESEVIGYFVEYSGMGFGLFMITEFVEVVVLSGVTTAVFFGGYHLPFGESVFHSWFGGGTSLVGELLYGSILATVFWLKVMLLCYVQLAVRWSFPRFRYDQIQRLGWQMLLPAGLINVFLSAGLILWDPSFHALAIVGLLEIAAILALIPGPSKEVVPAGAHGHGAHGGHGAAVAGHGGH
jgi:NADH-quinone oxidoreductase subunit H